MKSHLRGLLGSSDRWYDSEVRTDAQAVVIGGGVAGCSVAYHLARSGWTEVLVIERHELGEGSTWHSAGLVGQLRSTITQTLMIMYSTRLYPQLAAETGLDPGWRGVGALRLASTPERVAELRRQVSAATTYGLEMSLLSPAEAAELMPLLDVGDVRAAGWLPGDGYVRPEDLACALAAGARLRGVEFATHTTVTGIEVTGGRVRGVLTDRGRVATEVVVNAAGVAAGYVGRLAGAVVPAVPIKHQYVVSEPLDPAVDPDRTPAVRDPDHTIYLRGAQGGLLVGGYSRAPEVCWPPDRSPPLTRARPLFGPDRAKLVEPWAAAHRRVPALADRTIATVVNGPEAYTPDGEFLLGETPVRGFWVAAGFCTRGLAAAGGVGKALAEWIVEGTTEYDLSMMDIRRFGPHAASRPWITERARATCARYYDIIYPQQESHEGRPLRRSATWPRLIDLEANLGESAGWERVNWFDSHAYHGDPTLRPVGWAGRVWSAAIEVECRATAEAAGLFDRSPLAKIDIRGPGAATYLNYVCANEMDRPVGAVVYTQMLNDRAGIEADVTVTRLSERHFRIVTATASGPRDLAWLRRQAPDVLSIVDVTSGYGCLCLWGPAAHDILHPLMEAGELDFDFMQAREVSVGNVPVLLQRINFVGEPGWELYTPTEYTLTLWDTLVDAGTPLGLRPGGQRAIQALQLEKGQRVWGVDVGPETTPDEAGLGFAVHVEKQFRGRAALLALRASGGPSRRLRCLVLDDPRTVCLGTEPVRVNGEPAGRVTSGGYGYRVGASIAYAYLPSTVPVGTPVEVGVFGSWVRATVRAEPLYDSRNIQRRT